MGDVRKIPVFNRKNSIREFEHALQKDIPVYFPGFSF